MYVLSYQFETRPFLPVLDRFGVQVELGTELVGLEQNPEHVVARVVKHDGDNKKEETVTCAWLVGTDGGKGLQFCITFNCSLIKILQVSQGNFWGLIL